MRIAIGIEYDGTSYHGWQHQDGLLTVQGCVEQALAVIAGHPVRLVCAGRTDAGVHAVGQVAHFDTAAVRPIAAWIYGVNANLPRDITIHWAEEVAADFHARFSAVARSYRYYLLNHPTSSAVLRRHVFWYPYNELHANNMQRGADFLLGAHDFTSFRGSGCQAKSARRTLEYIKVTQYQAMLQIDLKANAFLQHMVRNIVGVLIAIGSGKREPIWAQEVLAATNRVAADMTAPPQGLYLTKVFYPADIAFADTDLPFLFMHGDLGYATKIAEVF